MPLSTIYLTSADVDIELYAGSPVWSARTVRVDPVASKTTAHWKRGLDVDTWTLVLMPRNKDPITGEAYPDKIGSAPFIAAARAGAFDGADIQIDRAYFQSWPKDYSPKIRPTGILTIFAGHVAEVDITDSQVILTINDYRELLNQSMPRHVYQSTCRWTLFDFGCTLTADNFKRFGLAAAGTTQRQVVSSASIVAPGPGTFARGKLLMTSGFNAGFSRTVKDWDGTNTFSFLNPFPFAIAVGDSFTAFPGCNKSLADCQLYGNVDNFGGQPNIPDATMAI